MRIENLKQCMMAGIITLAGACGDSTATESATDGGSGSGSTGATNETTEATSATTSGVSDSDSVTAGSNSESQTMGTTPTSTEPTTDATDTATTGKVTATEADTDTSTTAGSDTDTTAGTAGDSSSGTTGAMLGPCGDGKQWTLDADFDAGVLSNVNHDPPNGDQLQITVDGISAPKPYMFVAQTYEGWVLKLDTETGKQLARYETVRLVDCPTCDPSRQSWYPSRIIVDFEGDMFIANRAFGYQGSISKIAGGESGCLDRNKNGVIDTSSDANKDGIVDVNDPAEFKGQNDECVLYSMAVGAYDTYPRALTLDGQGSAYVGTYQDRKAYKLDITQSPPKLMDTYDLPSTPYGFVVRGDYLFSSALGEPVMRLDLNDKSVTTMNASGNYGITVDQNGIAFFGGDGLFRCDFDVGGNCEGKGGDYMSGVAIDAEGQVWGATGTGVAKFDNNGNFLGNAAADGAYGVAIGHDGDPRVISYNSAYRVAAGPKGGPPGAVQQYYTGLTNNQLVDNYTYTDFTGFGAQNVTVTKGEWTVINDGGADDLEWTEVLFNLEPEGKIPVGTSLTFQLRAANVQADLEATPWVLVEGNVPALPVAGRFYELRARLVISDQDIEESPVLSDVCVLKKE